MELICDGDSWVFGCEIVDPKISERYDKNIHPGHYDWLEENNQYRLPKIFPTHLGKLLDMDVTNLSWPADDNGTILNRTITYISSNYLEKNKSTEDLFVIIGWSSPERNFFWYKDEKFSSRFRIWPQVQHFDAPSQKKFWDYYVTYLWNREEYLPRYVMNVLQFQNFCEKNKIKWLCFNSFYQTPNKSPEGWVDLDINEELLNLDLHHAQYHTSSNLERKTYKYEYLSLWKTIDNIRFYKKTQKNNTFKSFIEKQNKQPIYYGWHPSPESHEIWALELANYIKINNLL